MYIQRAREKLKERLGSDESTERFVIKFSKTIQISNSLFNDTSKQSNNGAHLSCVFYSGSAVLCTPCGGKWKPVALYVVIVRQTFAKIHEVCVYRIVKFPEETMNVLQFSLNCSLMKNILKNFDALKWSGVYKGKYIHCHLLYLFLVEHQRADKWVHLCVDHGPVMYRNVFS